MVQTIPMSSNKRRKIEEFHDPDYCQDKISVKGAGSDSDRLDKIKMIIKREFQKEIDSKEEEIHSIDHKLSQTKRLLQRVRYAVALNYYTKQNLVHSANELKCETSATDSMASCAGQAVHPSLKKLLGKKPINYDEILKGRSQRNAAKAAKSTLIRPKKRKSMNPDKDVEINQMKIPRYISPKKSDIQIEKINSSRGRNQTSHLIVVGNTSRYIGDEKWEKEVTHKWLVYIKTKTSVEIENLVVKVRFFLHPSYQPNDVIEVDSPPFQIARRGWGEFPIRVQLYFHKHINQKPLQIVHNLKLDKKLTGLQTMGAETLAEIWLDLPIQSNSSSQLESKCIPRSSEQGTIVKPQHSVEMKPVEEQLVQQSLRVKMEEPLIIDDSPKIESQAEVIKNCEHSAKEKSLETTNNNSPNFHKELSQIFEKTVAKKVEPPKPVQIMKLKMPIVQPKKTLVRCLDTNGKTVFVEFKIDPNNLKNIKLVRTPVIATPRPTSLSIAKPTNVTEQKASTAPVINIPSNTANVSNHISTITSTAVTPNPFIVKHNANFMENKKIFILKSSDASNSGSTNPPPLVRISNPNNVAHTASTTKLNVIPSAQKVTMNSNNFVMKNGKIIILNNKVNGKPKQESLLKPQVRLMNQKQTIESAKSILLQKPSVSLLGSSCKKPTLFNQNAVQRDYYKEFKAIFQRHRFQTVRSAVEYLLKNTPLVNTMSSKPEFNTVFPFVAESQEKFNSFAFPRRRLNEWYRAKFILRMMQQHPDLKNEQLWMVKEIIIFGRRYGYTAANVYTNTVDKELQNNENPFKDIIKQHIKDEQMKNYTISSDKKINEFIKVYKNLSSTCSKESTDAIEIVDVDGPDQTINIDLASNSTQSDGDKLVLDLTKVMQEGGSMVNDVCNEIKIKLHQEEIVEGVLCSSSQLVLWQAMRNFIEDLIRRSFATKPIAEQISDLSAESYVGVDNVMKAISTTEKFSFLTNKHLGKSSSDEILGRAFVGSSPDVPPEQRVFFEDVLRTKTATAQWIPLSDPSAQ
ncbi:YEATS domain-containing protein 2 [Pseudolycoriella hygida]|uniref:YEATS domain-containing protein 2 n=1 Tax=Pseudolycoriella hygida TaxID=35572 RepID=A0A9Q0N3R2_9DIPT|nr:YEATS domain-containing protein 2 [Pseudolycoriella hygida]